MQVKKKKKQTQKKYLNRIPQEKKKKQKTENKQTKKTTTLGFFSGSLSYACGWVTEKCSQNCSGSNWYLT